MKQLSADSRGFNLIGVMISVGIFSMLVLGVSSYFSNMFKGVRAVDVKTQSQDFTSTLRLSMAKPDACRVILGLDKVPNPLTMPLQTYKDAAEGKKSYTMEVPRITVGGANYIKNTTLGDLQVLGFSIYIGSPVNPGSLDHIVPLQGGLKLAKGQTMGGLAQYNIAVPLRIKMAVDVPNKTASVVDCNSESPAIDPKVVCIDLGGRWLEGEYMPKSRCSVGGDITLAINELPDGIPDKGESNSDGERTEVCFYQKMGTATVKEWLCPSVWGNRKGPRCTYDKIVRKWQVKDFSKFGVAGKPRFECTKGVKISVRTPDTTFLDLEDPLHTAWEEEVPSDWDPNSNFSYLDQERLSAVTDCQVDPTAEVFYPCNNTTDSSLQGKLGSCLFVKGVKITGSTNIARLNAYNAANAASGTPPINASNYSGWIRATTPRVFIAKSTFPPINSYIAEAFGNPCFRVKVATSSMSKDSSLKLPTVVDPASVQDDPAEVKQCVQRENAKERVKAPLVPSAPPTRKSIFRCANEGLGKDELVDMSAGQCWYVKNTRIISYHDTNTPAASPPTIATRYTGWIYLKADLPDGKFTLNANGELEPVAAAASIRLNAYPCNEGVRIPNPVSAEE